MRGMCNAHMRQVLHALRATRHMVVELFRMHDSHDRVCICVRPQGATGFTPPRQAPQSPAPLPVGVVPVLNCSGRLSLHDPACL